MKTVRPFVSVIVPAYNDQYYLEKAVDSLLRQTYKKYEVIVVDDHSPTPLHLGPHPKLTLLRAPKNGGTAAARNYGANHAKGEVVLFADSDELFAPEHIAAMVDTLTSTHAEIVAQHTKMYIRSDDSIDHIREYSYWAATEFRLFLLGLTGSDILVAKEVFDSLDGFVAGQVYAEDWDFIVRAYHSGYALAFNDSGTKHHREHDSSITATFNWTHHRLTEMWPKIHADAAYTSYQKAIFLFGTLLWTPFGQALKVVGMILRTYPLFFVRQLYWIPFLYRALKMRLR